ncbi:MAG: arginine repressor [Acidimicrobiia bacterium]|nr:arginine repressor [Acidimicrobiia bacterium]
MRQETAERRRVVRSLLAAGGIETQSDLLDALGERGFNVTQATVSRDLTAIGATRVDRDGTTVYTLGSGPVGAALADLHHAIDEYVERVSLSGNLIVMTVPPGAAHLVASRIDGAPIDGILGTVAGDDTILIVADEAVGALTVARRIQGTD